MKRYTAMRRNQQTRTRLRPIYRKPALGYVGRTISRSIGNRVATKTATKTRTKSKAHKAVPLQGGGGSESFYSIVLKPQGIWQKVANKMPNSNTFVSNGNGVLTSGAGQQLVSSTYGIFGAGNLSSIMAAAFANSGKSVGAYTQSVFMKQAIQTQQYQNSTNALVRIQLWDVMAKRDCYKDHAGNLIEPYLAFKQGLTDQTSAGTGTEYQVVGALPIQSKLFNTYFKVKRITFVDLPPGHVHYHNLMYKIHRPITDAVISANSEATDLIKGWSLKTLVIAYGQPLGDNAGGSTTAAVRLNTVSATSYLYSYIDSSVSYSNASNLLATTISGNLENLDVGASAAYAAVT